MNYNSQDGASKPGPVQGDQQESAARPGRYRVLFRLWIVLSQEHQTGALYDGTSFFASAHAKWPPPR